MDQEHERYQLQWAFASLFVFIQWEENLLKVGIAPDEVTFNQVCEDKAIYWKSNAS